MDPKRRGQRGEKLKGGVWISQLGDAPELGLYPIKHTEGKRRAASLQATGGQAISGLSVSGLAKSPSFCIWVLLWNMVQEQSSHVQGCLFFGSQVTQLGISRNVSALGTMASGRNHSSFFWEEKKSSLCDMRFYSRQYRR